MKKIIISPYSNKLQNKENPKNYPFWNDVIKQLKKMNYFIIQVGMDNEDRLRNIDIFEKNLDFNTTLKELLNQCFCWFSVDNFFHHFATYYNKPGIVIFTVSDPKLFGHSQNINLHNGEENFRKEQYGLWSKSEYNEKAFINSKKVIEEFCKHFHNSNKF